MPITYVIDRFQHRMLTTAEGLVTYRDLVEHIDAESADRGLDLPELFDARAATTNITPEEARTLAHLVHDLVRTQPLGPTAIVTSNDLAFGMARMFSILVDANGVAVEVFRDLHVAQAWLEGRR